MTVRQNTNLKFKLILLAKTEDSEEILIQKIRFSKKKQLPLLNHIKLISTNQKNEEVVSNLISPERNLKFMIKGWHIHWNLEVVTEVDKRNLIRITFFVGMHKLPNHRFC